MANVMSRSCNAIYTESVYMNLLFLLKAFLCLFDFIVLFSPYVMGEYLISIVFTVIKHRAGKDNISCGINSDVIKYTAVH